MGISKFQNTASLVLMLSLVLMIGTSLSAMTYSRAQAAVDLSANVPAELPQHALDNTMQIALSDSTVKGLISNKPYSFMSYDQVGNLITGGDWHPEIHLNVANESQVTAEIDLKAGKVVSAFSSSLMSGCNGECGSMAINFQPTSSSSSTINALKLRLSTPPTYTGTTHINRAFQLWINGFEFNGVSSNGCLLSHWQDSYFAQGGFQWETHSDGVAHARLAWADTANPNGVPGQGCGVSTSTVPYYTNHPYEAHVYTNSGIWFIYVYDVNTGAAVVHQKSGVTWQKFEAWHQNTGIFFENHNTAPETPDWYKDFASPYTISVTSQWSANSDGNYVNWVNGVTLDANNCGTYQHSPSQIISGNVKAGGIATGNVQTFALNSNMIGC